MQLFQAAFCTNQVRIPSLTPSQVRSPGRQHTSYQDSQALRSPRVHFADGSSGLVKAWGGKFGSVRRYHLAMRRTRRPRGRPPHPDVLTPAEWRVANAVRTRKARACCTSSRSDPGRRDLIVCLRADFGGKDLTRRMSTQSDREALLVVATLPCLQGDGRIIEGCE
jgi:hypothetical protein